VKQSFAHKHPLLRNALQTLRNHPRYFIIAALCLAGFWMFGVLAEEVHEGDSAQIDKQLLLMLRNPADITDPIGGRWLEEIMRDLTALGGAFIVTSISLIGFIYLLVSKQTARAWYLAASVATGFAFSSLMKYGFDRPRPDLVPHGSIVYTSSFPSGHSLMSALAYLTLAVLLAEAQTLKSMKIYFMGVAILITMLTGISRVYLGVHWPSDVLAGWLGGASWAMMIWLIWTRILHTRKQKTPK
jgi:undecaprenyl-diphosphatase